MGKSSYSLTPFLSPLIGLADVDEAVQVYQDRGELDEADYRELIRSQLLPPFLKLSTAEREKAKTALAQALKERSYPFEDEFYSALLPFEGPENTGDFFIWLWEEFFEKI